MDLKVKGNLSLSLRSLFLQALAQIHQMVNPILPYPFQLPQDIYAKNIPAAPAPTPTPPPEQPIYILPPPVDTTIAVSNGGIYYGPNPPANPQYGWLWTAGKGFLYVYMEPGIWSQVATNW